MYISVNLTFESVATEVLYYGMDAGLKIGLLMALQY